MTDHGPAHDAARSMLPVNPRDFLILFSLVDGERHGYGVLKHVSEQSEGRVRLDPANLYRSLKRLMKDGLVAESERRPASDLDDERRRYYALTVLGTQVVVAEATRLSKLADAARSRNLVAESEVFPESERSR
jgi:DNA-binding PadR family transcriptional regulator